MGIAHVSDRHKEHWGRRASALDMNNPPRFRLAVLDDNDDLHLLAEFDLVQQWLPALYPDERNRSTSAMGQWCQPTTTNYYGQPITYLGRTELVKQR